MLKKTISYEDFDGNQHTEDFYFHLNEAELTELELTGEGNSLSAQLVKIAASSDGQEIIDTFKKIITMSYGERRDGGFYKEDDAGRPLYRKFVALGAYSHLFMELATDADAAAEFVNGIVPSKLAKKMAEDTNELAQTAPAAQNAEAAIIQPETNKELTDEELLKLDPTKMTPAQLQRAYILKTQQ